jgi:putative ABC transport system permease protein
MMDTLLQDLRYALRSLLKTPGFTLAVVLTLSLGIGANTGIFSMINALLLRDLPQVTRPNELALIGRTADNGGFDTFSYPDYVDLRNQSRAFHGIAAFYTAPVHETGTGATERARGALVSQNYFAVLGTSPAHGRFFAPDEDQPGHPVPVVVLSAGLWQRAFGGRSDIIGKSIRLDNHPFDVIGIAPAGFQGINRGDQLDLFLPLAIQPIAMPEFGSFITNRESVWLRLFGRLGPGASLARAKTELSGFAVQLAASSPDRKGWGVTAAPTVGFDPSTQANIVSFLRLLQGAVILVLAIACANVANLLLVRSAARRKELAIRASLGAGRGRILKQLLTESAVLAGLGGIGGLLLAYWGSDLLKTLPALQLAGGVDLSPDGRVLVFTLAIALAAGVLFGLLPAFYTARSDLSGELRQSAEIGRPRGTRLRGALVVTQVAVSLVLLVAAGLFVRTLRNAYAVDPGFATDVLVAQLDLGLQGYDEPRGRRFYEQLLRDLEVLPGVRSASLALNRPFGGGFDTRIDAQGALIDAEHRGYRTDRNSVSPSYFETMGITILRGRGFTARDVATSPPVAVINEAVAEQLWPGQEAVGKRFVRTWGGPPLEVIGVARDAKYRNLFEQRRLTFYQPLTQDYQAALVVHLRPTGDPMALAGPLQHAVRALDPDLPVYRIQPLAERLAGSLGQQRTAATLIGGFGALALLLAAIGLYGAIAYSATQRTREFGIRIALGAQTPDVLRQVLREGMMLGVLGLALGLVGAVAITRVLRSQLFGVTPTDPLSFTVVSLLLLVVVLVASLVPAKRATRVDPMVALRSE